VRGGIRQAPRHRQRRGMVMFWEGFLAGLLFAVVVWFVREVVR
jgi:predicted nucleic acid-binding Zn ribbon protein